MKIKRLLKNAGKFLETALTDQRPKAPGNYIDLSPKFRPKSFSVIEEERLYAGILAKKVFLPTQKLTNAFRGKNKKLSSYKLKRKAIGSEQGIKKVYNDTGNIVADIAEKAPKAIGAASVKPGAAAEVISGQLVVAPATKAGSILALGSGNPVLQSAGGFMLSPASDIIAPSNLITVDGIRRLKSIPKFRHQTPEQQQKFKKGYKWGKEHISDPAQKLRGKSIKGGVENIKKIPGKINSVLSLPQSTNIYPRPVIS